MSNTATPDPESARKKGPWANRVVGTEVVHTPEYDEFMKDLAEYHQKRGTNLTPEPELGRKILDLRKLYKTVTELGGYDKITETKGAWRDIANTYKPPVNNTNAGYLLKTIYYKNLAAYEISNFFHKDPPPKEWLEDRSAAGGAIMTRTAEDFLSAQSPRTDLNGESASPPPNTEKRSLRAAPTPRSRYAPDTTPARNMSRSVSQTHQQQNPATPQTPMQQQQPPFSQYPQQTPQNQQQQLRIQTPNGNSTNDYFPGTAHFPTFNPPYNHNAPVAQPVPTPRSAPHEFPGRKRRLLEPNGYTPAPNGQRIGTGHPGATVMYRILMGLKSGMEEEVNWGLNQLVRISHDAGDELRVDQWPGLAEILWSTVQEIEELANDSTKHGQNDTVDDAQFTKKMERINEAALIVRNLAMNDINARQFAFIPTTKDTLVMGLTLPDHPDFTEFKNYILDTVDAVANFLPYRDGEKLFDVLSDGLESDDRSIILGSLRSTCRFVMGRDEENRVGNISDSTVSRITSLLMLEDDELVSSSLDFLYQYTTAEENVDKLLASPVGVELIKHLTRLLLFHGITGEQLVYIKAHRQRTVPVHDIPFLPREIVDDLLGFTEPERATRWMRCCFEEDPESDITQIALWQAYQARFTEFVATGLPLLPAAEFIKNVSAAFTTASAMVLPTQQGQKFIIKGIRARETPLGLKGDIYLACKWADHATGIACKATLRTPQDLWAHVLGSHLPPPTESTISAPLHCSWSGCSRFGDRGETDRLKVVAHVRTHMPDKPVVDTLPREEQEMMEDPEGRVIIKRCQTQLDERGEAGGIPLTSALVLRNIKRRGGVGARELLRSSLEAFYNVMAVNRPLAIYVADLVLDA